MNALVAPQTRAPTRWAVIAALLAPWLGLLAASRRAPERAALTTSMVAPHATESPADDTALPLAAAPAPALRLPGPALAATSALARSPIALATSAHAESDEAPLRAGDAAAIFRGARAALWEHDGRVQGIRLDGDPRTWALGVVGLAPGDVIHAVNGRVLDSPDRALEAYWRLRRSDRVALTILRDGREVEIQYNLQ